MPPLVSVICLCYNHERFVEEAIQSVFKQTYTNWELIIIDDASTDESVKKIQKVLQHAISSNQITFYPQKINLGNCSAFNIGFRQSNGKYIIDLAADDVMDNYRLEKQVSALENAPSNTGVCFSNATLINEEGKQLGTYYTDWHPSKPQEGFVFNKLIRAGGMICSPTMLIKRDVLEELGGYDETLSYEDYDFWVRSSRNWKYLYLDEELTHYRQVQTGLHHRFKKRKNTHLYSTYKVCKKGLALCKNNTERRDLLHSVLYHGREALRYRDFKTAFLFSKLALSIIFRGL